MLRVFHAWVVASALTVLAACGGGTANPVERAAGSVAEADSSRAARAVPAAAAGQLHATVTTSADAVAVPGDGPAASPTSEILLFGDSVAVSIADELAAEIPGTLFIDAIDCRRLDIGFVGPCGGLPAGVEVDDARSGLRRAIEELRARSGVPDAVVVIIANNSALTRAHLDEAMDILADVPRVWWVTTAVGGRAWRDPNNALLNDTARAHPNGGLVDWFLHSEGRDWFSDHVHLNDAGQVALAAYVAEHLRCDCTP